MEYHFAAIALFHQAHALLELIKWKLMSDDFSGID